MSKSSEDSRTKLLDLQGTGYFTPESLLKEIVVGMSWDEAQSMLEHICDMNDINIDEVGKY